MGDEIRDRIRQFGNYSRHCHRGDSRRNAFGDVIDPASGEILAGARSQPGSDKIFCSTLSVLREMAGNKPLGYGAGEHTVIGVVATNAKLSKEHTCKVAQMAHDGLARTVKPAHTMLDGDTIFALSTGDQPVDVNIIGAFAAEVISNCNSKRYKVCRACGRITCCFFSCLISVIRFQLRPQKN